MSINNRIKIAKYVHVCRQEEEARKTQGRRMSSRFTYSNTAATRPLPIERALKTDILSILAVYQQQHSLPIMKATDIHF